MPIEHGDHTAWIMLPGVKGPRAADRLNVVYEEYMKYFARVSAGLESLAWQEIEQRTAAVFKGFGHRRIDFVYNGLPSSLLELRSVDDVYVYVTLLTGFDRTRADLALLSQQLATVDFTRSLEVCSRVRAIGDHLTYKVTASYLGKRNYSRYDIEDAVHTALSLRLPWEFKLNRPSDGDNPEAQSLSDLDVRFLLEDDWALVGLRLSHIPLHRRSYKVASMPGSLKAPVAYCLAMLADLQPGDTLLDPMCGVGTILIEALPLARDGMILGGDVNPVAVNATRQNLQAAGQEVPTLAVNELAGMLQKHGDGGVFIYQGDVRTLNLPAQSIQVVISNLPWNLQVSTDNDVTAFYVAVLHSLERLLIPSGRAVLVTAQAEAFDEALSRAPQLRSKERLEISLFGKHPMIYVLHKSSSP